MPHISLSIPHILGVPQSTFQLELSTENRGCNTQSRPVFFPIWFTFFQRDIVILWTILKKTRNGTDPVRSRPYSKPLRFFHINKYIYIYIYTHTHIVVSTKNKLSSTYAVEMQSKNCYEFYTNKKIWKENVKYYENLI